MYIAERLERANYEFCYLMLAGVATLLVISTCTVVSSDFSTSVVPGWHGTIFLPYFGVGAIYGGFCMLITLLVPLRELYKLRTSSRSVTSICAAVSSCDGAAHHLHLPDGVFHRLQGGSPNECFTFYKDRILDPTARPGG